MRFAPSSEMILAIEKVAPKINGMSQTVAHPKIARIGVNVNVWFNTRIFPDIRSEFDDKRGRRTRRKLLR